MMERAHASVVTYVLFVASKIGFKLVRDDPKVLDDGGRIPKISRKRLAARFLAVKSPLYLTENLPSG